MHRLIETTFRESLASNRRCFWLSGTDAIKPVATTPILHHPISSPSQGSFLDCIWTRPALLRTGASQDQGNDHGATARSLQNRAGPNHLFPLAF